MSDALGALYPAADISPSTGGGGSPAKSVKGLLKTRSGRVMLAVGLGATIAGYLYLRGGGTGEEPVETDAALSSVTADNLAGLGPAAVPATDIPEGGFDFQNIDPDNDNRDPVITIHIDPIGTGGGAGSGGSGGTGGGTVTKPKKKGYYRTAWGAGLSYQDGKGHGRAPQLTAAQRKQLANAEAAMRKRIHKNPKAGPVFFTLGGIASSIHNNGRINPR